MTPPGGVRRAGVGANAGWMIVAEGVSKLAGFVFVVIVARGLGAASYGRVNFAISFVPLFLAFSTWGVNVTLVREIAQRIDRVSTLFASGALVRAGLGLAAVAAAVAVSPLLVDGTTAVAIVAVIGLALLLDELSSLLGAVFKAFEAMRLHALVLVVNRIFTTALTLAVIVAGGGLTAVSVAYLTGSAAALATGHWLLRRVAEVRLRDASGEEMVALLRAGAPLGIAAALNTAAFRLDVVILQAIKGATAVGLYGVAYRFLESFLFLPWTLGSATLPRISRQGASRDTGQLVGLTFVLAAAFFVPLTVGAIAVAPWVITALFGERFRSASGAVPWLCAAGLFYAIAYLARNALVGLGHRRWVAYSAVVALVVNLATNIVAIPRYGVVGAAVATCLTEVVDAAVLATVLRRTNGSLQPGRLMAAPLVGAAAMSVAVWALRDLEPIAIATGALVYAAASVAAARTWAAPAWAEARELLRRPDAEVVQP